MELDREPIIVRTDPVRWRAAALAGLVIGAWFLLFPRGIPWSSVTFFSAAVMGQVMPANVHAPDSQVISLLITATTAGSSGNITGSSRERVVRSPVRRTITFTGQPQAL